MYYENMVGGKTKEWIDVYVHGKYGFLTDGRPVYPEYKDDIHSTSEEIMVNPGLGLNAGSRYRSDITQWAAYANRRVGNV